MVQYIEFQTALINTELGEAYTWIELRNQIEQNLTTKKLFDEWDKEAVLSLISPYLSRTGEHEFCSYLEALAESFLSNIYMYEIRYTHENIEMTAIRKYDITASVSLKK